MQLDAVRVKICGLRETEHAVAAIEAGADLLGLVFAPSRRQITPAHARRLINHLPRGRAEFVGVFVNTPPDEVNAIVEQCGLDWAQLSGDETPAECALIRVPVIKAFQANVEVDSVAEAIGEIGEFEGRAPVFLLDASSPEQRGGTGRRCDWRVAAQVARCHPTMLAGGLTADNVEEAIRSVRPWGVDVSSGVESCGAKDPVLIAAFVERARKINCEEHESVGGSRDGS